MVAQFLDQAKAAGESPLQRAIRILSVYYPQLQQTLGQDFYTANNLTWGPLPQAPMQPPAPPTLQRPTREQAQGILRSRGLLRAPGLGPQMPPLGAPPSVPRPDAHMPSIGEPKPAAASSADDRRRQQLLGLG